MPNVRDAQRRRKDLIRHDRRDFAYEMMREIHDSGDARFRVHDSGDMFDAGYIDAWTRICKALPHVRFWIPTKEWATGPLVLLKALAGLANVAMRPSAFMVNEPPPEVAGMAAGTMVVEPGDEDWAWECGAHVCPSTLPSSKGGCAENGCFACWDDPGRAVAYVRH